VVTSKKARWGVLDVGIGGQSGRGTYARRLIGVVHGREAEVECALARLIHLSYIPNTVRIFRRGEGTARRRHVLALRRRGDGSFVLCLVDGFDSVSVVVCELGVVDHLRVDVDAGVDEADGVNVEGDGGVVGCTGDDEVVLGLEVGSGVGEPVASVGLTPDAKASVVGCVAGESVGCQLSTQCESLLRFSLLHPWLHEVVEEGRCDHRGVGRIGSLA
jgi:hypothetical protein